MKHKQKKGFTLIELMLSVTFLATLAIMIAALVTGAASTYRRGIVLKRINLTGSEILDDLHASINNNHVGDLATVCDDVYSDSGIRSQCKDDDGFSFVSIKATSRVKIKGDKTYTVGNSDDEVPIFGAFCTGKYSYLWNSGYNFNSEIYEITGTGAAKLLYKYNDGLGHTIEAAPLENFRLIKILDEKRTVCVSAIKKLSTSWGGGGGYINQGDVYGHMDTTFDLRSSPLAEQPVELISGESGEGLALYDLTVARPAVGGTNDITLYSGSFILGSIEGGVNIASQGDYCKAFTDKGIMDADYCAVNRFNFSIQTSGL